LLATTCYLHAFAENWPLPEMEKRHDFDAPKHTEVEDMIHDLRQTLLNGSQNPNGFNDVIKRYVDPWNSELGKEVLFQHIRLMIPNYSNSVASDLRVIKKPTLIIWGEKDQQMPLTYAQRLHREIHNSQLVTIPNAGHLVLFDAPDAVANVLVDFVKGLQ